MQSMNISLPEPLKEFVDGQIASGRYSSASEYVRELIREDEKRKAEERLEALLLEGLGGADYFHIRVRNLSAGKIEICVTSPTVLLGDEGYPTEDLKKVYRQIADIMTPRPDIEWIDTEDTHEEMMRTLRATRHEQVLVGRGSIDEISPQPRRK